jgi:hypothetical protein
VARASREAVSCDEKLTLGLIDLPHGAKIIIVDLAIVVVLDLYDLVARAEGPAIALSARSARWIERRGAGSAPCGSDRHQSVGGFR